MDSLDFINTHKLILNNKEIDTIETNGNTDNTTILTKSAINNAISEAISGGGTLIGKYKSSSNTIPKVIINETNGITLNNKSVIDISTSGTSDDDKLTTQGFTDATYAKIEKANVFANENTFNNKIFANDNLTIKADKILKTNNIQTNTLTEKDIISYEDSTNSTKLTYGNTTDKTILNGNQISIQYYNSTFKNVISGDSITGIKIGDNTTITTNNNKDTLTTNNIIVNDGLILGGSEGNSVSSIIIDNGTGSGSNTELYTGKKINSLLNDKLNSSDAVGQKYSDSNGGEIFNYYTNNNNKALGDYSHAEGCETNASGNYSHAEGGNTTASGTHSHAEGCYTTASGNHSHTSGYNTTADKDNMFVCGKCNIYNSSQTTLNNNKLFVVGNGSGTASSVRSDAFVVKDTGEVIINSTASSTTPKLTIGSNGSIVTNKITSHTTSNTSTLTLGNNAHTTLECNETTGSKKDTLITNEIKIDKLMYNDSNYNQLKIMYCNDYLDNNTTIGVFSYLCIERFTKDSSITFKKNYIYKFSSISPTLDFIEYAPEDGLILCINSDTRYYIYNTINEWKLINPANIVNDTNRIYSKLHSYIFNDYTNNRIISSVNSNIFGSSNQILIAGCDNTIISGQSNRMNGKITNSFICGNSNEAKSGSTSSGSLMIGYSNKIDAYGNYCIIGGLSNTINSSRQSLIIGDANVVNDCDNIIISGRNNETSNGCNLTIGAGNNNSYSYSIILGQYNNPVADTIFCIGNGTTDNARSNLFLIKTTGEMNLNGTTPTLIIGSNTLTNTSNSIICGNTNNINNLTSSLVIGYNNDLSNIPSNKYNYNLLLGDGNTLNITNCDTINNNIISGKSLTFTLNNSSYYINQNIISGSSHNINHAITDSLIIGNTNTINVPTSNSIISGSDNTIQTYSCLNNIISGKSNTIAGDNRCIIGGESNTITNTRDSIICGFQNSLNGNQILYNLIIGSGNNIYSNINSSIISGNNNTISDILTSSIISGKNNTISITTSQNIIGGEYNEIINTTETKNNLLIGRYNQIDGSYINNAVVCGYYNNPNTVNKALLVVGNGNGTSGDPDERRNALVVYEDGKTYSPVFTTQNADYAELFEVYDETIPIKDYEYKFITLIDDKVKIASNEDDYILGVYSLKPGIIGNYNLDELNNKKNIQVGLLGRLIVIDNNTCKSNSYCKVDKNGYAIPYDKSDGDVPHYRVMKRIDNNKILIMFK